MLELFFPQVEGLLLRRVLFGTQFLALFTTSTRAEVNCPVCHTSCQRVHSYYTRRVKDVPWAEFGVEFFIEVRRFYCLNPNCHRQVFAERLGEAIPVYARRTERLTTRLQALGLALGGNAGARTAKKLGLKVSADTLLNLIRRHTLSEVEKVKVLGIDEFSFRRGHKFGTILVDLERNEVIELLPELNKDKLVEWLRTHPELEVISRDRAGMFAQAAQLGAPQAIQVADRFHLAQNLREACENLIREHYEAVLRALSPNDPQEPAVLPSSQPVEPPPLVRERPHSPHALAPTALAQLKELDRHGRKKQVTLEKRQAVYQEVKSLAEAGFSPTQIALKLGISHYRVKGHLKGPPKLSAGVVGKSKLEPYKEYLQKRCLEDHFDNAKGLWHEIKQQGYEGGYNAVCTYLAALKIEQGAIELTGKAIKKRVGALNTVLPSIRRLSWTLFLAPEQLKVKQLVQLKKVLEVSPALTQAYPLVQAFEGMVHEHSDKELEAWLVAVENSQLEPLKSFAAGVRRDEAAVRAGLILKWSQGPVEGAVTKLKFVKRSMYGRSNFDLLRIRMLAG